MGPDSESTKLQDRPKTKAQIGWGYFQDKEILHCLLWGLTFYASQHEFSTEWIHGNHFSMLILIILTKMSGHYIILSQYRSYYNIQYRGYPPPHPQPPTNNLKGFDKGRQKWAISIFTQPVFTPQAVCRHNNMSPLRKVPEHCTMCPWCYQAPRYGMSLLQFCPNPNAP